MKKFIKNIRLHFYLDLGHLLKGGSIAGDCGRRTSCEYSQKVSMFYLSSFVFCLLSFVFVFCLLYFISVFVFCLCLCFQFILCCFVFVFGFCFALPLSLVCQPSCEYSQKVSTFDLLFSIKSLIVLIIWYFTKV